MKTRPRRASGQSSLRRASGRLLVGLTGRVCLFARMQMLAPAARKLSARRALFESPRKSSKNCEFWRNSSELLRRTFRHEHARLGPQKIASRERAGAFCAPLFRQPLGLRAASVLRKSPRRSRKTRRPPGARMRVPSSRRAREATSLVIRAECARSRASQRQRQEQKQKRSNLVSGIFALLRRSFLRNSSRRRHLD